MTPKEKARELVEKYIPHIAGADRYNTALGLYDKSISKECALIVVDEILQSCIDFIDDESNVKELCDFYLQVKQKIEKL